MICAIEAEAEAVLREGDDDGSGERVGAIVVQVDLGVGGFIAVDEREDFMEGGAEV